MKNFELGFKVGHKIDFFKSSCRCGSCDTLHFNIKDDETDEMILRYNNKSDFRFDEILPENESVLACSLFYVSENYSKILDILENLTENISPEDSKIVLDQLKKFKRIV